MNSNQNSNSKRGFKEKWLSLPASDGLKWMKYDKENDAVFCTKCLIVTTFKTGFNDKENGYTGGKKGIQLCDLKAHTVSKSHQNALKVLSQKSAMSLALDNTKNMEKERFKRKDNVDVDEWYPHSMRAAYFLANNNMPYSLMDDLCWLIQDVVKVSTGKVYANGYGTYSIDSFSESILSISPS
jgi:hypothetical protein